jgi:hypothetical protein
MNPLQPQQNDGMPTEVATSILSEPKARITNTFRKQCQRARCRVFVSAVPVLSFKAYPGKLFVTEAPAPATPPADKLTRATIAQLRKWLPRCIARRLVVQNKAVKLTALAGKFEGTKERARLFAISVCEHQAASLDAQRELLEDEIARRMKRPLELAKITRSFLHIDPAVRRRAALRRSVAAAQ